MGVGGTGLIHVYRHASADSKAARQVYEDAPWNIKKPERSHQITAPHPLHSAEPQRSFGGADGCPTRLNVGWQGGGLSVLCLHVDLACGKRPCV